MSKAFLLSLTLLLAGCDHYENYQRADVWHPSGVNAANLAATVVDQHDLIHGQSVAGADAGVATSAIERLRKGGSKAIPKVDTSLGNSAATASSLAGGGS